MGFWESETCEYCGDVIVGKKIDYYKRIGDGYAIFQDVPAGVCKSCGTRYYNAKVLKKIEEDIKHKKKVKKTIQVPIYSF